MHASIEIMQQTPGMVHDVQASKYFSYICGLAPISHHGPTNWGNYRMDRMPVDTRQSPLRHSASGKINLSNMYFTPTNGSNESYYRNHNNSIRNISRGTKGVQLCRITLSSLGCAGVSGVMNGSACGYPVVSGYFGRRGPWGAG